jgi:hypothetical protein
MSKKKNTLKDLDEFLKQQAATLVSPSKLNEKLEEPKTDETASTETQQAALSFEKILDDLRNLSATEGTDFRKTFYTLIVKAMEAQGESLPEDKMLINTALYLKNRQHWKDAIREYWRDKK